MPSKNIIIYLYSLMSTLIKLEFINQGHYFELQFKHDIVEINVFKVGNKKNTKFHRIINVPSHPGLSQFISGYELYKFIEKGKNNYQFTPENMGFVLRWKLTGDDYQRIVKHKIQLQEISIESRERLQLERKTQSKQDEDLQKFQKAEDQVIDLQFKSKNQEKEGKKKKKMRSQNIFEENELKEQQKTQKVKPKASSVSHSEQKLEKTKPAKKDTDRTKKQKSGFEASQIKLNKRISKDKIKEKPKKEEHKKKKLQLDSQNSSQSQEDQQANQHDQSQQSPVRVTFKKVVVGDKVRIDFVDGGYYFGETKDNQYHGKGYCYSKTFGIYDGDWKEGKRHGVGKYEDVDHNKYEGQWKNDLKHGKGQQIFSNSQKYIGQYKNDLKHGFGIYYFQNGDRYQGTWVKDFSHGHGKQFFVDGSIYQGYWLQDERHGQGTYTKKNESYKQLWEKGQLIRTTKAKQKN